MRVKHIIKQEEDNFDRYFWMITKALFYGALFGFAYFFIVYKILSMPLIMIIVIFGFFYIEMQIPRPVTEYKYVVEHEVVKSGGYRRKNRK